MSGRLFRVEHVETDDKGDLQTATLLGPQGETLKRVHRLQPFGFHSSVPKGRTVSACSSEVVPTEGAG